MDETEKDMPDFVGRMRETWRFDGKAHDCIISFSVPFMISLIASPHFRYDVGQLL